MKAVAAIAACALLSACQSTVPAEPRIEIQTVKVPVATSCKPNLGPDPVYPDTDAALQAAPNLFEKAKLVMAGRLLRIQREIELRAALAACMGS